ncbi:MAG: hypothetical protein ACOC2Y_03330 [Spirochaetota bacterium]
MKRFRVGALLLLGFVVLSPVAAETVSISVRQQAEQEEAPVLADFVEQGAMEHLFTTGHVVFDLEIDPADDLYLYRAIGDARTGGASYLVILELAFSATEERGLLPDRIDATMIDLADESVINEATLFADDLDRYAELDAETIAIRLGSLAAEMAAAGITGGEQGW